MKRKVSQDFRFGQEGFTVPTAILPRKMFKIFRKCQEVSTWADFGQKWPSVVQMLCKNGVKKLQVLDNQTLASKGCRHN